MAARPADALPRAASGLTTMLSRPSTTSKCLIGLLAALAVPIVAERLPAQLAMSSPTAAAAVASQTAGVQVGIKARLSTRTDAGLSRVTRRLRAAGVTHVREDVSWARIERSPGVFRWEGMDRWVVAATQNDLEIIALVGDSPAWATPGWNVAPTGAAPLADFSNFVRRLVQRYGTNGAFWRAHPELKPVPIRYYDIWNEPYVSRFWSDRFPDPAGYARMFKAVVQAARPVDPRARFLLEADTRVIETGWPWQPFLSAMFDAVPDLGEYAYAVSVHPYQGDGGSPRTCSRPTPSRGVKQDWRATVLQFCRIEDIRRILDARGAHDTRIWITEIGWSTAPHGKGSVSERRQAAYVSEVFDLLRARRGLVSGVVWYEYQAPARDPARHGEFFGLVGPDGTPKPAWDAFRAEAGHEASGDLAERAAAARRTSPETRITRKPPKLIRRSGKARIKFAFVGRSSRARFACRLGSATFSRCTSPIAYRRGHGSYRFQVRATDAAGDRERRPATYRFKVKPQRHR